MADALTMASIGAKPTRHVVLKYRDSPGPRNRKRSTSKPNNNAIMTGSGNTSESRMRSSPTRQISKTNETNEETGDDDYENNGNNNTTTNNNNNTNNNNDGHDEGDLAQTGKPANLSSKPSSLSNTSTSTKRLTRHSVLTRSSSSSQPFALTTSIPTPSLSPEPSVSSTTATTTSTTTTTTTSKPKGKGRPIKKKKGRKPFASSKHKQQNSVQSNSHQQHSSSSSSLSSSSSSSLSNTQPSSPGPAESPRIVDDEYLEYQKEAESADFKAIKNSQLLGYEIVFDRLDTMFKLDAGQETEWQRLNAAVSSVLYGFKNEWNRLELLRKEVVKSSKKKEKMEPKEEQECGSSGINGSSLVESEMAGKSAGFTNSTGLGNGTTSAETSTNNGNTSVNNSNNTAKSEENESNENTKTSSHSNVKVQDELEIASVMSSFNTYSDANPTPRQKSDPSPDSALDKQTTSGTFTNSSTSTNTSPLDNDTKTLSKSEANQATRTTRSGRRSFTNALVTNNNDPFYQSQDADSDDRSGRRRSKRRRT